MLFLDGKKRWGSVENGSAAGANTEGRTMVFVLGGGVLVLGIFGVYGGRCFVGDQREIILARDEGQEEDIE